MTQFPNNLSVILLGDDDTAAHREELSKDAAQHSCVVAGAYSFTQGEAGSNEDLTGVDAVVSALGRAIADRLDIWVPFPIPDLGREQHFRRLILVLQRHGLNLRFGRELTVSPPDGGINEIDFALRREVQIVDDIDHAALAAAGAESLGHEIELALAATDAAVSRTAATARQSRTNTGTKAVPRAENTAAPTLPAPTAPWVQRKPVLKRYARWLVHGCGVTQAATARVLNSTGQRTAKGRLWQPGTVSALVNGRYDRKGSVPTLR